MRFPITFTRKKGGGAPALPSNAAGAQPGSLTSPPNATTMDNLLQTVGISKEGWPVQRIVVAPGTANPGTVSANLYYFDENTQGWYLLNSSAVTLTAGVLAFFDTAVLIPPPQSISPSGALNTFQVGVMSVFLAVFDTGASPAGTYVFAVAADLTTVGT